MGISFAGDIQDEEFELVSIMLFSEYYYELRLGKSLWGERYVSKKS
jgi:hypothetical protein